MWGTINSGDWVDVDHGELLTVGCSLSTVSPAWSSPPYRAGHSYVVARGAIILVVAGARLGGLRCAGGLIFMRE